MSSGAGGGAGGGGAGAAGSGAGGTGFSCKAHNLEQSQVTPSDQSGSISMCEITSLPWGGPLLL